MAIDKQPSCDDPVEPELLPVSVALERMQADVAVVQDTETLALRDALNRVLADDIKSPLQVPAYTNSAMDGFAINSEDLPVGKNEAQLKVLGTSWAGRPFQGRLQSGEAVQIMTGGMLPEGADTVVIQEHAEFYSDGHRDDQADTIRIDGTTGAGRNVRQAGEDIGVGETVLQSGTVIEPAQLGLISSLGVNQVTVKRRLRVAYFSTGDELRALEDYAGKTLGPGEIFDSNRHTLFGLLSNLNVELIDLGVVRDDEESTRAAIKKGAEDADLVITSGGVSAGQADFVSKVIGELGELTFWKLAMRPGRPLVCGLVDGTRFFGLPGNPVAVMVTFYEFVQPTIKKMMGCGNTEVLLFNVTASDSIRKRPGRIEYQRGILSRQIDGSLTVATTGKQGAGRLSSMSLANCIIVLPVECDGIAKGDTVQVQPFYGLV